MAQSIPDQPHTSRFAPVRRRTGVLATVPLALALAAVIGVVDLLTDSAIGVGFLVLVPLLAAARDASPAPTGWLAALSLALAIGLGALTGYLGESVHTGPALTVALGGLLAIYLARLRESRDEESRRLEIQYLVARTLQDTGSLSEAAPALIGAIGAPLGWQIGGLWEVRQPRVLRCVESWYAEGVDPAGFDKLSRQFVLRPGVGVPGRVWETGKPVWVTDVSEERGLPRAELAAKAGLHGAVGFPLRTSSGVVGVMEFFAHEVRPPDSELLDLLAALGGQIGEFIEVQNAAEALRESEARKGAMLESALDCVITMDHEGRVVEFNPAAERTFGYSQEDAVGAEMAELIVPPSLRELHRSGLARYIETGESKILGHRLEFTGMRSDGSEFPMELAISRIGGQSPPMFTGYVRDITERRRAEAERERLLELERLARVDADSARGQLEAILRGVADAVTAQGPDGRVIFANQRAVKSYGCSTPEDLLGATLEELRDRFEIFDENGHPVKPDEMPGRRALAGDPAPEAVVRQADPSSGDERWLAIKSTPIRDEHGAVAMAINITEDITELKRAEGAQRLLAEAGRALASSLETAAILRRVVRLAVPEMADWCGLHSLGADGAPTLAASAASEGERQALIAELVERFPADARDPVGVPRVLRTGQPALHPEITPDLMEARATSPEHLALLRRLARHSGMTAPVLVRGRPVGAISFYRVGGRPRFDEQDLAVAEELGRRIGGAVENARLYAERSYIAKTLQESLLPAQLPDIPGLEAGARFRATGEGNEVGGDFYDLFDSGGGNWSVVVGDVCGKGPDAAAVTALARYTLRAAAMREPAPSDGLRVLNEALLRQRSDMRFATVAYASLLPSDHDGTLVRVASAGHPLPLLLRVDGSVEAVGVPGTLVGVVPDPDIEDATARLAPGDALVFYTDGVTEARDETGIMGDERLIEILAECAGLGADAIAERIEREAVQMQHGETRDDIAVVVLRACGNGVADVR